MRQHRVHEVLTLARRVRRRLGGWRQVGADSKVLQWLQHGVKLPWIKKPPPPFDYGNSCVDASEEEQAFLDYETARLLASGAWELTQDARFVSRAFLAPKPGHTD